MRVAYLTGEYPRVTDTFIQREVAALRSLGKADGSTVETFSVRSPKSYDALSTAQKEESDRTSYLLPANPFELLLAHLRLLTASPKQYLQALGLAWQTRQLGIRGTLYQLIYFLEAGILASRLRQRDITHLHNHFGDSSGTVTMLASALGGFGYSMMLHGPAIFFEPYRWRLDEKIRRAKFVSCISDFCRSQAMIFAPLAAWPNLHIVHCGVDPAQFGTAKSSSVSHAAKATPLETELTTDTAIGPRLIFVGRLAAAKGLPVLLQSMASLTKNYPDVHLTVVGDGEDRALLEAQMRSLNLSNQVSFVGYQSPEIVRDCLAAADIFVMSSFAEGVPVVLMEAMMSGLPVVATRIAGVSELVEDTVNGFTVPPGNVPALTERIEALLADVTLRKEMGDRGKQKVSSEFNIHHEARKLYHLMERACSSAASTLSEPTDLSAMASILTTGPSTTGPSTTGPSTTDSSTADSLRLDPTAQPAAGIR